MPRKAKVITEDKKTIKKNLLNTIVKDISIVDNEDIILQLPITEKQINDINKKDLSLPEPYDPNSCYLDDINTANIPCNFQDNNTDNNYFNTMNNNNTFNIEKTTNNCYWCCHHIDDNVYGMPYKYVPVTDTYVLYGCFCSLHCANAYNFSVHTGSDKCWEINSFIQMLSKHYGYTTQIRPAPSRFLLKIFNGPLSIEEFRSAHLTHDKTHLLNIPPMISTTYNYEVVNTSYLKNITDNMNGIKNSITTTPVKNKTTIDAKLNLIISG